MGETCSDGDNEQTFKSNMMTLAFDGSEDHIASVVLVEEEMLIFREQSLTSTAPATTKELRSKITKPEGVRYNPEKDEAPIDEGCDLFDADDGSLEKNEEINSDNNLSDSEPSETADMNVNNDVSAVGSNSNDEVSKETTTNELPNALSCNLGILNEIDHIVKKGKEASTNQLIPYLIQIESSRKQGHLVHFFICSKKI